MEHGGQHRAWESHQQQMPGAPQRGLPPTARLVPSQLPESKLLAFVSLTSGTGHTKH